MIIPHEFLFKRPDRLKEVLSLLSEYGARASVLAGGTDLVVNMKYRSILQQTPGAGTSEARYPAARSVAPVHKPEMVIALSRLNELRGIKTTRNKITLGPLTTMTEITDNVEIPPAVCALQDAALCMGSPLVRNRATIGGNLANARPAADGAVAFIALNGRIKISSLKETRWQPSSSFITAPGRTVCRSDELITALEIAHGKRQGSAYIRQGTRKQMEIAIVGAGVWVAFDAGYKTITGARICLGAVGPIPLMAVKAAAELTGKTPEDAVIAQCAKTAQTEARPIDDFRGSAEYRTDLIEILVSRAIKKAIERARTGENA